jgi:tetratricopeptide (TPR) repeat protein
MTESEDACRRGVEHAARAGDHLEEVEILAGLALPALAGPRPVTEAIQVCEGLWARVQGNRRAQGFVLTHKAQLLAMVGLFDEARQTLADAGAVLHEAGIKRWIAGTAIAAGFIEAEAGNLIEAERNLRDGGERGPNSVRNDRAYVGPYLARVLCDQGRYQEALEEVTLLDNDARTSLDVDTNIYQLGARARAMAGIGQTDDAERLAREAVAIGATTDCLALHGDALSDLAHVLAATGKLEQAAIAAREAIRLYEAKGFTLAVDRAKTFLLTVESR